MSESPSDNSPSLKAPRRFRFSLRTLLVVMAILCILLGWKMNQVHRQRRAVEAIRPHGGGVEYDYQFDLHGNKVTDGQPRGPAWLRKLAGDDFFAHVVSVGVSGEEFTNLSPLADLPNIKYASLQFTGVTDLTPLATLTDLEDLLLVNAQVEDIAPLVNCKHLEILSLSGTQVRDVLALSELRELLWLDISRTDVTDLSPLRTLEKLRILRIHGTLVSEDEIEALERALPELTIVR